MVSSDRLGCSVSLYKDSGGQLYVQDKRTKGQVHVAMHCEVRKPSLCQPSQGKTAFSLEPASFPPSTVQGPSHPNFCGYSSWGTTSLYITLPVHRTLRSSCLKTRLPRVFLHTRGVAVVPAPSRPTCNAYATRTDCEPTRRLNSLCFCLFFSSRFQRSNLHSPFSLRN
jgi:hypothetical protein